MAGYLAKISKYFVYGGGGKTYQSTSIFRKTKNGKKGKYIGLLGTERGGKKLTRRGYI